ncbi:MAG: GspMb/PilO family protein [Candidatus Sumerlaeota bacterium]|nr:GspMb/PilO family protein [Candidatus Sumerlaeota bacterium]
MTPMPKDPKQRQRLMLIVAACLIGAFASDRLVFTPQWTAWNARAARIAQLEQDLSRGRDQAARRAELVRRWREMEKRSLPASPAAAEDLILKSVGQWAKECRLDLSSVKPRPPAEGGRDTKNACPRLGFRASARGSIQAIAQFLWRLESAPLPLHVDEIEIAARDKGKGGASDELSLDIQFNGLLMASAPETPAPESKPAAETPEEPLS